MAASSAQATLPNGGSTSYACPSPSEVDVYQDQNAAGDQALRMQSLYDGLGRPVESRAYESANSYSSTTTIYDALGRAVSTSNPAPPGDAANYTTYLYDALGRTTQLTGPDGALTCMSYWGSQTTTTDPYGLVRVNTAAALGRLISVVEDPFANPACNSGMTARTG